MTDPDPARAASWPDGLRARLFEARVVLVSGPLAGAGADQTAAELMTLDALGDEPIELRLDGAGGDLAAALALMDVVDLLGVEVRARAAGRCEGPLVGLFAVAHHRAALPNTRFRLTEPAAAFEGDAGTLARFAELSADLRAAFCDRVARACRRPTAEVAQALSEGRFLSAEEARAFGLVDEVLTPGGRIRALPGRPVGFSP
jgi:ATP-dependent Clp protease protease subunit